MVGACKEECFGARKAVEDGARKRRMENIILQLFERYRFRCVLLHPAQPDTYSGEELDIIISTDYALPPNLRLLPRANG